MKTVLKLLEKPVAEWPQALNSARGTHSDIAQDLAALIQRAVLLHGYVTARYTTGYDDRGHDESVSVANRKQASVRTLLGYSYPNHLPLSIL